MINPQINIISNPNGVLFGVEGDIFYREDDNLFRVPATGSAQRVDLPMKLFLGKYNNPFYSGWPIKFEHSIDTWIKGPGERSKYGWKLAGHTSPFLEIVSPIFPTPTVSVTSAPVVTPTVTTTVTPSETIVPTATPASTVTPPVTATPAITPTVTPSTSGIPVSATPSISPSPTPSPTPSPIVVGCAYVPPTLFNAPTASGYSRGFANTDYNEADWQAGLPYRGAASNGAFINMTDDGNLIYVCGAYNQVPGATSSFILVRNTASAEGFDLGHINSGSATYMREPYGKLHQIARNGNIIGTLRVAGQNQTALWPNGYQNAPIVGTSGQDYQMITMNGLYTFGTDDDGILFRYDVSASTTQSIGDNGGPAAIDWCGEKAIVFSLIDPDGRYVMIESGSGGWTEEVDGYFVLPGEDYPFMNDMSANGEIVVGALTSFSGGGYWRMSDVPTSGSRTGSMLPGPADTGSYGESATALSISPDATVIIGGTEFGYLCYWVGPTFATCSILGATLAATTTGPQSVFDDNPLIPKPPNIYSVLPFNSANAPQVGYGGKHIALYAEKEINIGAPPTKPRSVLYCVPTIPLSEGV